MHYCWHWCWEGDPKITFAFLGSSQITSHGCCKGTAGEYHSPNQSSPKDPCFSACHLWLVKSTFLGKDEPFGVKGKWEVGPPALPSSLVLFPHRNMCLCGGRGRRDNLIYDGCVLWSGCHNCLLGLGSNRQQNRERVCPEEGTPLQCQAQKD